MPFKEQIRFGLILVANLVLFYFLYRWVESSIRWDSFLSALLAMPTFAIVWGLVTGVLVLSLYGQRLTVLLGLEFKSSFWIVCYGFGANSVLPFRLGDALKLYFARRHFDVSATRLLFIKVVEKVFDLSFLLLIGLIVFLFGVVAVGKGSLMLIGGFLAVFMLSAIGLFLVARRDLNLVARIRQHEFIDHGVRTFEEVVSNPANLKGIGVSALIWMATVCMVFVFYRLALPDFQIGWIDALALVFVTTLSLGIPSAPGAFGVFEAAVIFYLTTFVGVSAELSLAVALVLHLLIAGPQVILMLCAMLFVRLNPNEAGQPN